MSGERNGFWRFSFLKGRGSGDFSIVESILNVEEIFISLELRWGGRDYARKFGGPGDSGDFSFPKEMF